MPTSKLLLARPILGAALAVALGSGFGASGRVSPQASALVAIAAGVLAVAPGLPARRVLLHLFVAAAAALRAGTQGLPEARDPPPLASGAWRPSSSGKDWMFGDLGPGMPRIALARDTADPDDAIALLDGEPPRAFARGPVPGRAARAGIARPPEERTPDEVVRLASARSEPLGAASAFVDAVRGRLLERVRALADARTRGLVGGLLFGDLSEIDSGVADLFVRTGTFHVLAISGLQVVLVAVLLAGPIASVLDALARWLSRGRLRLGSEIFRAALLLLFVPVAGAGAPVTRSALAWIAGSLALRLPAREPFEADLRMRRSGDPLALWGFALLVECLVHPDAPLSVSVQLTYLATLGLVAGTRPMLGCLRGLLPGEGRVAAVGRSGRPRPEWLRIPAQRILDASLGAVAASCAAVLATLPVVWTRFGEACPWGALATPAIAMPVGWILVAGWAWVVAPGLVPEAALDVAGRWTIGLLEAFDRLPGSPADLPPRPFLLLASACVAAFAAIRSRSAGRNPMLVRAAALLWVAVLLPWSAAPPGLEVHALDVGSGTAVLVREPGGGALVFDAGSRDRPGVDREALGPLLSAWESERVLVVLSHTDLDHDGALPWLVERHPPAGWAGALPAQIAERLPHTAVRIDATTGQFLLAWPDPAEDELRLELSRGLAIGGNEGSRVLEIRWKSETLLLFGDSEAEGLAAWLHARAQENPARLLLFPHHGSDTEHLAALVEAVRPKEVWISASGEPEVLRELARRRIPTHVTSLEGPLSLELP
jgi:competence protein ComEC